MHRQQIEESWKQTSRFLHYSLAILARRRAFWTALDRQNLHDMLAVTSA
jgi:hypothetical protein